VAQDFMDVKKTQRREAGKFYMYITVAISQMYIMVNLQMTAFGKFWTYNKRESKFKKNSSNKIKITF
jgi:hypothetical protein